MPPISSRPCEPPARRVGADRPARARRCGIRHGIVRALVARGSAVARRGAAGPAGGRRRVGTLAQAHAEGYVGAPVRVDRLVVGVGQGLARLVGRAGRGLRRPQRRRRPHGAGHRRQGPRREPVGLAGPEQYRLARPARCRLARPARWRRTARRHQRPTAARGPADRRERLGVHDQQKLRRRLRARPRPPARPRHPGDRRRRVRGASRPGAAHRRGVARRRLSVPRLDARRLPGDDRSRGRI